VRNRFEGVGARGETPIDRLGASGIRFSSVNGKPISAPEFLAVFESMTRAIWRSKGSGLSKSATAGTKTSRLSQDDRPIPMPAVARLSHP